MRRLAEISLFLPLAAGLHVAAFGLASGPQGGAAGGAGDGGEATVTLAAAPPLLSRLAEDWQAAPQAQVDAPRVDPPKATVSRGPSPEADRLARAPAVPPLGKPKADMPTHKLAPPGPVRPALAEVRRLFEPPAPGRVDVPAELTRPRPRPGPRAPERAARDRPPEVTAAAPRPSVPPPSAAQTARGAERKGAAGQAELTRAAPAVSPARTRALRAEWGAQILARLARVHRYPRGTRATGRAMVDLVVGRDGRLVSVRLRQSAGDPVLDRAALATVRGAGRFPSAPGGLQKARYSFTLPLTFAGRR
ncbi:protein TonB [Rhodovulum sp. ES.010]|uniref:energy transducer TonB family protein n=1 Tax=Rhodovulum sp. ES.010 TaxID=1882821 RepID=UPI000925DABF|nr:energy transducer TonB [Rhodovulum sp. ES.010]SIO25335.1 protein TonB [Rhodovulum sp. ES.010]